MLKIAVIIALLAVAYLASKYLDEKTKTKALSVLLALLGVAVVIFVAGELFR